MRCCVNIGYSCCDLKLVHLFLLSKFLSLGSFVCLVKLLFFLKLPATRNTAIITITPVTIFKTPNAFKSNSKIIPTEKTTEGSNLLRARYSVEVEARKKDVKKAKSWKVLA